MASRTIYQDAHRRVLVVDGVMIIQGAQEYTYWLRDMRLREAFGLSLTDVALKASPLRDMTVSETLPSPVAQRIRQGGEDPTGWYSLGNRYGRLICLPPQSRAAVERAIEEAKAAWARDGVSHLFAKAERLRKDPERYKPALRRAKDALRDWQARFPAAAKAERKATLLAEAAELQRQATAAPIHGYEAMLAEAEAKIAEAQQL